MVNQLQLLYVSINCKLFIKIHTPTPSPKGNQKENHLTVQKYGFVIVVHDVIIVPVFLISGHSKESLSTELLVSYS